MARIEAHRDTSAARRHTAEVMAVLDAVEMDYSGSHRAWRFGGGRDLDCLEQSARTPAADM